MHSRKELVEMEKQEKEEKARKEVESVKRKLIFKKEEREKEEKKKEEQRRQERQKMTDEAEDTNKKATDDEIPAKRGRLFTMYLLCLKSDSVESFELIKVSPDSAQCPPNISLYEKNDSVESPE